MSEQTSRYGLALLVSGQGQKDITHNEAIEAIDALLHPLLLSRTVTTPPSLADPGASWLIPDNAVGEWEGWQGSVAVWTAGGWRYLQPTEGFVAWLKSEGRRIRKTELGWQDEAPLEGLREPIAMPLGGAVIDVEARASFGSLVAHLAQAGLINRP